MSVDLTQIIQPIIEPIDKELVSERSPCKRAIHSGVTAAALTILPAIAFVGSMYWYVSAINEASEGDAPLNNPSTGASCALMLGSGLLSVVSLACGVYAGWEMGPVTLCQETVTKIQTMASKCIRKNKEETLPFADRV